DLDFKEFSRTLKERLETTAELQRRFDDYDFIISPVAAGPAFPHNHQHSPIRIDTRSVAYIDYAHAVCRALQWLRKPGARGSRRDDFRRTAGGVPNRRAALRGRRTHPLRHTGRALGKAIRRASRLLNWCAGAYDES